MSCENTWARKCLKIPFKLRERKSVGKSDNSLQIFGDWQENKQINLPQGWSLFFFFSFLLLPLCYPSSLARDHLSFILFFFQLLLRVVKSMGPYGRRRCISFTKRHLLNDWMQAWTLSQGAVPGSGDVEGERLSVEGTSQEYVPLWRSCDHRSWWQTSAARRGRRSKKSSWT